MLRLISVFLICLLSVPCFSAALRDPTRPATFVPDKPAASNFTLTSILVSPDRRIAIINGQSVQINDTIQGGKVIDITPEAVLLKSGDTIYSLQLINDVIRQPILKEKSGEETKK